MSDEHSSAYARRHRARARRVAGTLAAFAIFVACGSREGAAPGPSPSTSAPSTPPAPTACTRDDECLACGAAGCVCGAVAASTCPPMRDRCVANPCTATAAACHDGRCVVRAAQGPCERDEDCEVRPQDCGCDCEAVLASAPRTRACAGVGCGGRPSCVARVARCDPDAHVCALAPADE